MVVRLKGQPGSELHDASWLRAGNGRSSRRIHIHVGQPKIRVIRRVEHFPAELQVCSFANHEAAAEREVQSRISRPVEDVAARVAKPERSQRDKWKRIHV